MLTGHRGSSISDGQSVPNCVLGLSLNHWVLLIIVCLTAGLLLADFWFDGDLWVALACAVSLAGFVHLCLLADRYVAFPGLIGFIATLELLIAPVVAIAFPTTFTRFRMATTPDSYLQYAIPATVALWIGLHWPVNRTLARRLEWAHAAPLHPRPRAWLDVLLVVSLIVNGFAREFPEALFFFVTIVGSLCFFAALCWMVTRTPGWKLRVGIVMLQLIAVASADGIFYLVAQWGGFFLLVYGFRSRWRGRLALALGVALLGAVILQYIKSDYRRYISTRDTSFVERVSTLGSMAWNRVTGQSDEPEAMTFGDVLVRFNQGWIVSRIMNRVPYRIPYAKGETVKDAFVFAILPRVLFPDKPAGASRILFARFTGLDLSPSTTMGLSIIGEMYANFGTWGGVVGVFVFGSVVGLAYRHFVKLARTSPHWWAAAPVVLLAAIEPAWNLEDISNYIIKSALVLFILVSLIPELRELLKLEPIWRRRKPATALVMPRERAGFNLPRAQ